MLSRAPTTALVSLGAAAAAAVLALDLLLPLGVAAGTAHVCLVLISLWLPGSAWTYGAAAAGTTLNGIGWAFSQPSGEPWMVLANRLLALFVIWAAAVIVVQRKQTQQALLRAERRLGERVVRAAPNLIYIYDLQQRRLTYANPEMLRRLGCSEQDLPTLQLGDWQVHEDDQASAQACFARCRSLSDDETLGIRCRIGRRGEKSRWYSARHVAFSASGGSVREILGVAEDVTEREEAREALRRSEAELRRLASRLITVQEEERKRAAREIHDDIGQRMAAVAIATSKLRQAPPASREEWDEALERLGRDVASVSDGLHRLSRQLHPSVLENLGLEAALEAECDAFADREGIPVRFESAPIGLAVSRDVALCLYRVAQEALHNVARHARARSVSVTLSLEDDAVELRIQDDGRGYTVADAKRAGGIGLTSMEERSRLAGAELRLTSAPGAGAEVVVRAPLSEEDS